MLHGLSAPSDFLNFFVFLKMHIAHYAVSDKKYGGYAQNNFEIKGLIPLTELAHNKHNKVAFNGVVAYKLAGTDLFTGKVIVPRADNITLISGRLYTF